MKLVMRKALVRWKGGSNGGTRVMSTESGVLKKARYSWGNPRKENSATDPAELKRFIQRYGVTHWLINRRAFAPVYIDTNQWIRQTQPEGMVALDTLEAGKEPILESVAERCSTFRNARFLVVDAHCLAAALPG